jgi:hypothetical protein
MWNSSFVCCCLLRNMTILFDHFINVISVSLISGCLWSAVLLVTQAGKSKVCITDMCCQTSHSADVYIIIPLILFPDEFQSLEDFLQSDSITACCYSTLASSPYTVLLTGVNKCWLSAQFRQKFYSPDISFTSEPSWTITFGKPITAHLHSGEVSHYCQQLLASYTCQNSQNKTKHTMVNKNKQQMIFHFNRFLHRDVHTSVLR